jgi:hypothetical protein
VRSTWRLVAAVATPSVIVPPLALVRVTRTRCLTCRTVRCLLRTANFSERICWPPPLNATVPERLLQGPTVLGLKVARLVR